MEKINKARRSEDFFTRAPKVKPLEEFGIDKVAEKVGKSKFSRLFAGLALTSAIAAQTAACNSNPPAAEVAPLPSGVATKSPYELAPTTSELTATLAPTLEPTLKPTEVKNPFEGLSVCVDWKNPCPATEEDLMSGRLIDFAKSVGQPFPKEAYNTGRFFIGPYIGYTRIAFDRNLKAAKGFENPPHPEQELYRKKGSLIVPYRWLMHFSVSYNEVPYLISIQQWLNPDASISYLQYVVDRLDTVYDKKTGSPREMLFEKVGEVMPVYEYYSPLNQQRNDLWAFSYDDQERIALIREWQETSIIPEKLQYKTLDPITWMDPSMIKLP